MWQGYDNVGWTLKDLRPVCNNALILLLYT